MAPGAVASLQKQVNAAFKSVTTPAIGRGKAVAGAVGGTVTTKLKVDTKEAEATLIAFQKSIDRVLASQGRRVRFGEGPEAAQVAAAQVAAKKIEEIEALKFKRVRNLAEANTKKIIDAQVGAAKESADRFSQEFAKNFNIAPIGKKLSAGLSQAKTGGVGGFIQNLQTKFEGLGKSVGLTGTAIAQIFKVGFSGLAIVLAARIGIAAVKMLAGAFKLAVTEASNLNEAVAAVNITFGESAPAVRKFAEGATSLGLSTTAALNAARAYGTFFQALGATEAEGAQFAKTFTQLSTDIATFANAVGGAEEVNRALEQALAGNFRGLQKYGFVIRDADVETEAFTSGIIKQRSQLSTAVEGNVRAIVLLDRFAKTIGNTSREFGNLNAAQERLKASTTNLRATIGAAFEPLIAKVVSAASVVVRLLGLFAKFTPLLKVIAATIETTFGPILQLLAYIDRLTQGSEEQQRKEAEATRQKLENNAKEAASLEALKDARLNLFQNTVNYLQAQQAVIQADAALVNALNGVVRAEENLADVRRSIAQLPLRIAQAELALEQARLDNARAAFFIADAEHQLRRAREGQVDAARNLVRAEQDLPLARRNLIRAGEDIAIAERNTIRSREDQITAVQNLIDVQNELASNRPIIEAQLNFEQAQLKVKEASLGTTKALQEMLDAQLALVDAQFDLERAQRRGRAGARDQLRAIVALQKAQLQQADAALAPERAALALRDAVLDLAKVQEALVRALAGTDAANKLRDALRGVEDANTAVRDSDRGLEDAHTSLRDADRGLEDAHLKIRDANNAVEDSAIAVRNAEFELLGAHLSVRAASLSVASAQDALTDVLIEAERAPRRLAEAEKALKDAHDAVSAAALAAALAHLDLQKAIDAGRGIIRSDAELMQNLADELGRVAENGEAAATAMRNLSNVPFGPGWAAYDFGPGGRYGNAAAALAMGGPLRGGQLALVGEKGMEIFQAAGGKTVMLGADGPEFFRPPVSGQVIPNSQLSQFMRVMAAKESAGSLSSTSSSSTTHHRGGDTYNIHEVHTNPDVLAHKLSRYIARRSKR